MLLTILLFNWIGYRFLAAYMEERADARLTARLDVKDYVEDQLISIKLPTAHLVYYNNSQFTRVDGQVEIGGVVYKYVKRRVYNDSIEYRCLLAPAAQHLVNDLQPVGQEKKDGPHKSFGKNGFEDYYTANIIFKIDDLLSNVSSLTACYNASIGSCFIRSPWQPPDTMFS